MSALVQTAPAFLEDFLQKAARAKHRIWLQSMVFESGTMMDRLAPILIDQAKAGLDVRIEVDWVSSRFVHGHLPLLPILSSSQRNYNRQLHHQNRQVRQRLASHGVQIIEVNRASLISQVFPMFRRNHVKLFIIDDQYGWVGGINLLDRAFSCQDFMVRFDTKSENQILRDQYLRVNSNRAHQNLETKLNETDTLLTDAGKIANSIIYNRALELINQAQTKVCFISQFVPEGRIRDALMAANDRGVSIEIINSFSTARKKWSTAHLAAYRAFIYHLQRHPTIAFRHSQDRIHAKLLIIDEAIGLFGSHNLVDTGVLMGTEEIAVQTHNQGLVDQLVAFKNSLL